MMATNDAIMRVSSGSFLARTPLARANWRSLNGLTWHAGKPAASKVRIAPRSYPPLASRPIAAIAKPRNRAINSAQPAASLRTAKLCRPGSTMTSRRSFDTSIPQNESIAIFVPLPG